MIDPAIGNMMPFVPFESETAPIAVLVGARFLKESMMAQGHSEEDALEYIASCRRLEENRSGYVAADEFDTVLAMCKRNAIMMDAWGNEE